MKKFKFIILLFLMIISLGILCSCSGEQGPVGPQGEQGIQGDTGNGISSITLTKTEGLIDTYTITFTNGSTTTFTVTNGKDGAQGAQGEQGIQGIQGVPGKDGHTPVITIQGGYWYIDGVNTNVLAEGIKGDTGNGISSITLTKTEGLIDTYTITFTNGSTTTFTVTNGKDGVDGAQGEQGNDGKSAYEIYVEAHPEYTKSEEEWIIDLINGQLITKTYTIIFDSVGGTEVAPQKVLHGYKASKPIIPERLGYTFDGWYIEDEKWVFSGYPVTEDITLTAKWIQNEYTLTLNNQGLETKFKVHYYDTFELPILVKEGFVFEGWIDREGVKYQSGLYEYLGDIYLTASFRLYRVTFDSNGGNSIDYYESESGIITELPTPTREGYIFYGWYYNNELVIEPIEYNCDITLVANWININEEFSYVEIDKNTAKVISYNGTKTDVVIPSEIDGYTITEISNSTFANNKNITSIILPSTLTLIEDGLLEGCNRIESIQISEDTPTTMKKLYNVSSASDLPSSLDTIKYNDGTNSNNNNFFAGVTGKYTIILPNTLSDVGHSMFRDCIYIKEVIIPEGVTVIGTSAFNGCSSLESIVIPEGVTIIDTSAFSGCSSLESIVIPEGVTIIDTSAFSGCSSLKTINIPNSVIRIWNMAFSGCSSLEIITIPEGVTVIEGSTFSGCSSLTNVIIPEGVTDIKESAFSGCSSLKTINIPDSVTSIGSYAFGRCTNLKNIVIPEGVTIIKNSTFYNCSSLESITMPDSVTSIEYDAFNYCGSLESIVIPEGVTSIVDRLFYYCSDLENIVIPDSVNSIGEDAFYECTSLKNIVIPEGVTIIKNSTFYNCSSLESITMPDSVTSIGSYAFKKCSSLASIVIPKGVISIGENAFDYCGSLASIVIHKELENIYDCAFWFECNLNDIYYTGTSTDWSNISIGRIASRFTSATRYYYSETEPVTEGNYWRYIDGEIVIWPKNEMQFTYEETEEFVSITGYTGIDTNIIIPSTINGKNVNNITSDAFRESNIVSVTIPKTITSMGYAFYDCKNLTNVYYDGSIDDWCNIEFSDYYSNPMLYASNFYMLDENNEWYEVTNIEIPKTIKSIGKFQFMYFENVTSITFEEGSELTSIEVSAFRGCCNLKCITIPNGVQYIDDCAFSECSSIESIDIPQTVKWIGNSVFLWCSSLKSIVIPEGITAIHYETFCSCESLTTVIIPESVTLIENEAFNGCISLENIIIPKNVTNIGNRAFYNCLGLKTIVIPEGVKDLIGAFDGCSSLKSVVIPNSVNSISIETFTNCDMLENIYYKGTVDEWSNIDLDSSGINLTLTTIYYYSETEPTEEGNYWHYDIDGVTPKKW